MSHEIIYTSAPQGLKPGSHGFCTVAATAGIAKNLLERLESLSGYRHAFMAEETGGAVKRARGFGSGGGRDAVHGPELLRLQDQRTRLVHRLSAKPGAS